MFSKYEEEEEKTVPLIKNEMDPSVKDYLMKKNNLGDYSDQARQGVTEGAAPSGLDFLSSALGAISAGFGGRDPMAAQQAVMRGASERGERDIASFDKGRANQVQMVKMDRALVTQGREDEKYGIEQKDMMDERDASSKISMAYQQQLKKMQPNMDVSGMSASDIKGIMNPATKVYDMEQRKIEQDQNRMDKRFELGQTRDLKRKELEAGSGKKDYQNLPEDKKKTIETLSVKNANKSSIVNQIDSFSKTWDALPDDQKVAQGRQLLKTLNSSEGADAIGTEEANRLGAKLEFALGNLTNSNPIQFGRDLDGFKKQMDDTSSSLKGGIKLNQQIVDKAYGREVVDDDAQALARRDRIKKLKEEMGR